MKYTCLHAHADVCAHACERMCGSVCEGVEFALFVLCMGGFCTNTVQLGLPHSRTLHSGRAILHCIMAQLVWTNTCLCLESQQQNCST
jgi:hypothetical protein